MKNVLVVDDEPDIYELLKMAFWKYGDDIHLESASNGKKALDRYREMASEGMEPDAVLMDIRMPGMSGIETTEKLKEAYPDAKIYVFTAFGDTESALNAMNAGARDVIKKSENIRDVIDKIKAVLDKI